MYPYNKNQIANKENTKTQEKEKLFSKESKRLPTISSYHEKDLENCSLKYNYEISPEE